MSLRKFYLIGFLILVTFDTLSQLSFKFATLQAAPFAADPSWLMRVVAAPWTYGAIAGYLGAFVTWITLLQHAPIGPAVAASHLQVVVIMVLAVPLFDEHLSALQLCGAALIIGGVVCLAIGESDDAPV
jgi:drug/metabolite transporter (DMT)-like permease